MLAPAIFLRPREPSLTLFRPTGALLAALFLLACAAGRAQETTATVPPGVENAVVKVFSTVRYPDAFHPWTKQSPTEITGSGAVIDARHILTNAHVVLYASQVQIQANQGGDRISANVVAIAPGIDLALLSLDDESFFRTHAPIPRAERMPEIKDAVLVYGFPAGGNSLSITKGIVSRIEFVPYNMPASGLRVQIDAAINPGNSGGPAVVGDRMAGLAFSKLGGAENIGYIIPNEEIDLFLRSVAAGPYRGKPLVLDEFQTLENPALRRFLLLDDSVQGIVVREPWSDDPAYPLKRWDVVTQIADTPIDNQGMIGVHRNLRVAFPYLVQKAEKNGKVALTVVRAGKPLRIELPVPTDRPMLMPDLRGEYPPYFVYGPIVFTRATMPLSLALSRSAEIFNRLTAQASPLMTLRGAVPTPEREELVVVPAPFFPHKLVQGYSNHTGLVLLSVNGVKVKSLAHMVALLRDLREELVVLEFEGHEAETLVVPRRAMESATEDILNDNGVRSQGSAELMEIWKKRGVAGN